MNNPQNPTSEPSLQTKMKIIDELTISLDEAFKYMVQLEKVLGHVDMLIREELSKNLR